MTDDTLLTRRAWMERATSLFGAVALTALLPRESAAAGKPIPIVVYKDPSCGCCTKWADHLKASGFAVQSHDRSDMDALKDSLGVPKQLRSCHTAVLGRYVIEGHVPAADLKQLRAASPKIIGLAVPGMPNGSPGMEVPGRGDRYEVVAFAANGKTRVFARH